MDFNLMSSMDDAFKIREQVSNDFLLYSVEDDPKPMDTTGNLIDKLCIVNNKMFWNQDVLYQIRRMTPEEFIIKYQNNMSELYAILKRCTDLNAQRARLMDEIDQKLIAALKGEIKLDSLSSPQHKTY